MKLMKRFSHVNCRAFCFSNRCIDASNSLSNDIVFASSVCAFKSILKRVDFSKFLCYINVLIGMV